MYRKRDLNDPEMSPILLQKRPTHAVAVRSHVEARRVMRGLALCLFLISMSVRFLVLATATAEVRAVWIAGGGKGGKEALLVLGGALAAAAGASTAGQLYSSLVEYGVPEGWAGLLVFVSVGMGLAVGGGVVKKVVGSGWWKQGDEKGQGAKRGGVSERPGERGDAREREFWKLEVVLDRLQVPAVRYFSLLFVTCHD